MSLDMDHRQWRDHEDRIRRLEETMMTDEQPDPSVGVVAQSMQEAILAVCRERLTAAGFAIVPTAAGNTVTISREELDEAVHWYLPSASQANAIIADIITRATRAATK